MTILQMMPEDDAGTVLTRTADPEVISAKLAPLGIGFERWQATKELTDEAGQEEVLEAYKEDVDRLKERGGYRLVDVVRMKPTSDLEWEEKARAAREKFRAEHIHDEDEVRFFVAGSGCFYLHIGTTVVAVVCTAGDLLSVPTGTRHWYDMGARPDFAAIRFFQEEDGWVGNFTSSSIAARFPTFDELTAS